MADINGKTKLILWILAAILAGMTFMGRCMYANDLKYEEARRRIEKEARQERAILKDTVNTQYQEIIQRLTRIESRL